MSLQQKQEERYQVPQVLNNPKSALNPLQSGSKKSEDDKNQIIYMSNKSDSNKDSPFKDSNEKDSHQNSDQESLTQINKLREQYVREKLQRKKQAIRLKKEEFGSSSSDDDYEDIVNSETSSGRSVQISNAVKEKIRENSGTLNLSKKQWTEGSYSEQLSKPQKIYQLKGKQSWTQQQVFFNGDSLSIQKLAIPIEKISKIKSMPELLNKDLLKIKLNYESQEMLFGVSAKSEIIGHSNSRGLSLHYSILALIISRKLRMMGIKTYLPEKNLPGIPQSLLIGSHIHGKIYKKSQILGRWQERLIIINGQGLYSYKRFNEKHSMFIASDSVKQIWTRFQIFDQNLLVVKMIHTFNTKTEFGIPVTDFLNQKNWLFQLYQMGLAKSVLKK